jgi:hypothetical protein
MLDLHPAELRQEIQMATMSSADIFSSHQELQRGVIRTQQERSTQQVLTKLLQTIHRGCQLFMVRRIPRFRLAERPACVGDNPNHSILSLLQNGSSGEVARVSIQDILAIVNR